MEKNQLIAKNRDFYPDNISRIEGKSFQPVNLAFMGDGIYESYIRRYVVLNHPGMKVGDLHRLCTKYVRATAQSAAVGELEKELHDDELFIFKRGRNAATATVPKNTSVVVYKRATGFEAVIGYLFLTGKSERMEELIEKAVRIIEKG
ncbi:Mini-ribonuclease 3 [Alkalibacter mobilis]|uniref:Mini-ribonuclease 3 n=1 Tax=Alkalibacter mobilis TaxID=2787712 RepID=UPI00189F9431|nr:ribonuclease III domain-containing protein [Alkalibacter mobilis]MBF7095545.1 Mini-ribonuclease 3 [Alkalibacter mobilis]